MCASGVRLRPVRVVQFPKRRRPTATYGDVMDCVHLTRHQCMREATQPKAVAGLICQAPWNPWYCTKFSTLTWVARRNQVGSIMFSAFYQDRPQVSHNVCQSCKSFSFLEALIFLSLNFGCFGSFRNFHFSSCVNLHIRERNDGSNLNFRLDVWGV